MYSYSQQFQVASTSLSDQNINPSMDRKCLYLEFLWSIFSRSQTRSECQKVNCQWICHFHYQISLMVVDSWCHKEGKYIFQFMGGIPGRGMKLQQLIILNRCGLCHLIRFNETGAHFAKQKIKGKVCLQSKQYQSGSSIADINIKELNVWILRN